VPSRKPAATAVRPGALAERGYRVAPFTIEHTDWVFAALALVTCLYPVLPFVIGEAGGGYNAFLDRQGLLAPLDVVMGAVLLLLILEATRRTTGWILPAVCLAFLAYGYYGGYIPQSWEIAHAGLDFAEIVDALYNSGSGFYGTPLDVAASYILLFTIYGAALELGGAGKFFVDLSVAAFRESGSAPGRTAVAAARRMERWTAGSTARSLTLSRQRASGCRRNVPVPVQGTSISTASIPRTAGKRASPTNGTTLPASRRRTFSRTRASRANDASPANTTPAVRASSSVLPPGAAQRSATCAPDGIAA